MPLPLGNYHYVGASAPTGGPVQKRLELTDLSLEDAQKTLLKFEDRSKISSELFAKVTDLLHKDNGMYICTYRIHMYVKLCDKPIVCIKHIKRSLI